MTIRSNRPLYRLLETTLRKSKSPMTCVELMEQDLIRSEAIKEYGPDAQVATNKLSDALGFMWRKGLLVRYPASKETRAFARYAYAWDDKNNESPPIPPPARFPTAKQGFVVTEYEDGVIVEFEKFVVMIRPK